MAKFPDTITIGTGDDAVVYRCKTISIDRPLVEIEPKDGWKQHKRGNKLLIEVTLVEEPDHE